MKTIIIGAGVVGTITAYHLARAGHEVTVIDKHGTAALGASFANAAQLSYTYVEPMADPAILPKLPKWLFSKHAPMKVHFSADLAMWKWCIAFLIQCTPKRFAANRDAILKLSMLSKEVMDVFLAEHEVAFDYSMTGKLHLFPDEQSFASAKKNALYKQSLGYAQEILEGKTACVAKEPALAQYPGEIAGGVFAPIDATGGTYQFCQALLKIIEEKHYPAEFVFNTECKRIVVSGGKIECVETDKGSYQADYYIIAAGVGAVKILKPIGIHVPIYPIKGYSVTYPIKNKEDYPKISITDHANKVAYAPLGDRIRIAGGVELAGYDISCPQETINKFNELINNSFPGVVDSEHGTSWAGLRPATPSGVPIIGQGKPYQNLYLNIGQGMLGWTLAQGSGKTISEIISNNNHLLI